MTFHSIVRLWCKTYKSMLDNEKKGNRRFYLTDTVGGVVDIAKSISSKFSPFVLMESAPEMEGEFLKPYRLYPIYIYVKAEKMSDGDEASAAYEEALLHAAKFRTWLLYHHEKELEENIAGDFAMIDLENTRLSITPVGPLENGWYAVCMQLERMEPLDKCINPDDYIEIEDDEP